MRSSFPSRLPPHKIRDDPSPAQALLDEVNERRSDLEEGIWEARNAKERSPLRKELWWLEQLSRLLHRWIAEQTLRGRGNG